MSAGALSPSMMHTSMREPVNRLQLLCRASSRELAALQAEIISLLIANWTPARIAWVLVATNVGRNRAEFPLPGYLAEGRAELSDSAFATKDACRVRTVVTHFGEYSNDTSNCSRYASA
jgi:hypothetical protein